MVDDPVFGAGDDSTRFDYKGFRANLDAELRLAETDLYITGLSNPFCNRNRHMQAFCFYFSKFCDNQCNNDLDPLRKEVEAWEDALNYVDDANAKWETIIGARRDTLINNGLECICEVKIHPNQTATQTVSYPIDSVEECGSNPNPFMVNCQAQASYVNTTYRLPNDGVVPAESAKALPGKTVIFNDESRYI